MKTLQVQNLNLAFADRDILKNVSFNLNQESRVALTGANGSGKSTLLKCVVRDIDADSMDITLTKDSRISYLPQEGIVLPEKSVYEIAEDGYKRFFLLEEELERIGDEAQQGSEKAAARISEINDILLGSGFFDRRKRIEIILQGLGFGRNDFNRRASEFSGGYQMRIALSRILTEDPDFLFLDEPTNYLDIDAMTWLTQYLHRFKGGVVIVSHDQDFLDENVKEVYEIFNGKLGKYKGNYTEYVALRKAEIEALNKARKEQEEEIKRTEEFIERFRYKATKAKQVQSRIKALEKIEIIETPEHLKKLSFRFPPSPHSGNDILKCEHIYKAYPTVELYNDFSLFVKKKERLAITGRNGSGKSTLLKILTGKDTDYRGSVIYGSGVLKAYYAQEVSSELDENNTVLDELRSVSSVSDEPRLRSMLGAFLFRDDDILKKIKVLSGGEKSRLALLKILMHPSNLLFLDEPTNHLDISSKDMLLNALKEYEGTVIFVSHDKHFIKNLSTRILYLSDSKPEFFEGDYSYFEYKLEEKEKQFSIPEEKKDEVKNVNTTSSKPQSSFEELKLKRNRIRALERESKQLLDEIEKLEKELTFIKEEMNRSEVYSDAGKINSYLEREKSLTDEKESKEERYLLLLEEIESVG